jgi:hypothetical protein
VIHYKTVNTELLELIEFIMNQLEFDEFNLVGGTSLALFLRNIKFEVKVENNVIS